MHSSRSPHRASLAAALSMTTVLFAPLATGCGLAQGTKGAEPSNTADSASQSRSAGLVRDAVDKVLEQKSATLVAELDGPPQRVESFLRRSDLGLPEGDRAVERGAELLARAQLVLSLGGRDKPLNELSDFSQAHLAAALNLGDRDLVSYKSVDGETYLRMLIDELSREKSLPDATRRLLKDFEGTASELPDSLGSVRRLLSEDWVTVEPDAYEQFGWAVRRLTGSSAISGQARTAASTLDGEAYRQLLDGLRKLLTSDGTFTPAGGSQRGPGGRGDTAERADRDTRQLDMTVSARDATRRLAPALNALGVTLEPAKVTDRKVRAEVTVRRGVLVEATLDIAQLTGEESGGSGDPGRLPLRFKLGSGAALSVRAPEESKRLEPQDMLAALLYGTVPAEAAGS